MIHWRWGPSDDQVRLLREFRESSGRKHAFSSSNFLEFIGPDITPNEQHVIEFLWGHLPIYYKSHPEPFDELRDEIADLIRFLASRDVFDPEPCLAICAEEEIFRSRWSGLHLNPLTMWLEELRSMLELRGLPSTIPAVDPDDIFGRRLESRIVPGTDALLVPELVPVGDPTVAIKQTALTSAALSYVSSLLEIIGSGSKLTATGNLNLADGRALAEMVGCQHLFDEKIGQKVFRTQSTSHIEPLDLTFQWSMTAGFVRNEHGRLIPTRNGRQFGKDALKDWWALFRAAVLKLDWAKRRYGKDRLPFWAELVCDCAPAYLRAAVDADARGLAILPLAEITWRMVQERWVTDDLSDEQIKSQQSSISWAIKRGVFAPLELLGACETWTGAAHGAVRISPLGRWAASRLAEELAEKRSGKDESGLSGIIDLRQWRLRSNGASAH